MADSWEAGGMTSAPRQRSRTQTAGLGPPEWLTSAELWGGNIRRDSFSLFLPRLGKKKKKNALNVFLGWQHLKCNWNIISSLSFTWNLLWVSAGEVEGKWMIGFSSPPNQRSSACQICQAVHLPRVPASLSQAQKENQEPQRYFLFSHPIFFFPFTHHLSFFHISFLSEFIFFRLVPQSSRFFLCVSKSISPS